MWYNGRKGTKEIVMLQNSDIKWKKAKIKVKHLKVGDILVGIGGLCMVFAGVIPILMVASPSYGD